MRAYNLIQNRIPNSWKQVSETMGICLFFYWKAWLGCRTIVVNPIVKYSSQCIQVEFNFYKISKMRFGIEGNIWLADTEKYIYQTISIFSDYYTLMTYPIKKEFSLTTALSSIEIRLTDDTNGDLWIHR